MSNTKPVVHLRVYKSNGSGSTTLSYDANGNVQNTNQRVTEIYDTTQWVNYLKHITIHGFIKVVVEGVEINGEAIEDVSKYQKEVDLAMNPTIEKELTPEQKQIAELKSQLDALLGNKKPLNTKNIDDAQIVDELAEARAEYEKVFGKKGHHSWDVAKIKEKIAELKNTTVS